MRSMQGMSHWHTKVLKRYLSIRQHPMYLKMQMMPQEDLIFRFLDTSIPD